MPPEFVDPVRAPRPDGRRYIVHPRYRVITQPLDDTKAKARGVNRDERIGAFMPDRCRDLPHAPDDSSGAGQHFDQSHDGEFRIRKEAIQSVPPHLWAANAGKANMPAGLLGERCH